jgi:hypothetical protein
MIGQWYDLPTPASGDCPALLWRFVADPQRAIGGSLARMGEQPFARLSGTLGAGDTFRMVVTTLASGRSAIVTGQFTAGISTLSIQGDGAGAGCDGKTFSLRLSGFFAGAGGGGGGGG